MHEQAMASGWLDELMTEAIGPCGVTFPNNQVVGLASVLRDLLRRPEKLERYRQPAANHLQRHRRRNVAQRFLEQMQRCLDARWGEGASALLSCLSSRSLPEE